MNSALSWWLTPVILVTQEDYESKPVQANNSKDPILKKKNHNKKVLVE
jgi:hypothetical protein